MSRHYGGPPDRPAYSYFGSGGRFPPGVKGLVIANAAVFVLQLLDSMAGGTGFLSSFGLRPSDVSQRFFVWQLATYLFLHGGFFHIFFNMFVLWMFGSELERSWGPREFLRFYFVCGIGAGLLSVIVDPGSMIPTIGASGAVYGVLLAYGILFPNRIIYLYMIIPLPAKYFVMLIGGIAFMASFSGSGDGVAHIAHLGGMLFGYLYLRGFSGRRRTSYRSKPGWRDRYDQWRRARLRRKFEVYYNKRQQERDKDDDPGKWMN